MAAKSLVKVAHSATSLDPELASCMEPRVPHPQKRLAAIRALSKAHIQAMAIVTPIIPSQDDHEIEAELGAGSWRRR